MVCRDRLYVQVRETRAACLPTAISFLYYYAMLQDSLPQITLDRVALLA